MSYYEDFIADYNPELDRDLKYMQIESEAKQGYWTTKSGETIHISKMSTSHILNTIKYIERHDKEDYYLPWIYEFNEELKRRGKSDGIL